MSKRSSIWLIAVIAIVAVAFMVSGCAKKQVVKEEAAAKAAPAPEVKTAPPAPAPAPVVEAPKPEPVVQAEPAKPEAAAKPAPTPIDLVGLRIQFAFDDYSLSAKSKENLEKLAKWMSDNADAKMQIEGHTCEVGTAEYNLALGERRANSAKMYLQGLGVATPRLSTISYGEERPLDPGHNEQSRSKNRRDEFVQMK
jgi:peptidoglycan-associated lipoprotein